MTENKYIVGNSYIDKSSKKHPKDQLLKWLDNDNVSIANLGGIRKKSYTSNNNKCEYTKNNSKVMLRKII